MVPATVVFGLYGASLLGQGGLNHEKKTSKSYSTVGCDNGIFWWQSFCGIGSSSAFPDGMHPSVVNVNEWLSTDRFQ